MQIITLQEEALYLLIEQVVARIKEKNNIKENKWISAEAAMAKLHIGKSTLQKLRNTGAIRYSQPEKKIILYDTVSIDAYLEKHAKETF